MIGFYAAGAMVASEIVPTTPPSYIGGTFAVNPTASASPSIAVPGSAASGDTVVVILRCRADRSFSGFTGWTTHLSTVVRSGQGANINFARVYILSRTLAAESSFSFTQSASAVYGAALLVFRDGSVGANNYSDGLSSTITKSSASSMLLAVGMTNANATNPSTVNPAFTGYTQRGYTSFLSGGLYYYTAYLETRDGVSSGSTTATGTFPTSLNADGAWLAEIG